MPVTPANIAKLYCLLTGESERVFQNRFSTEQAANLAANIDHALSSDDIFGSSDIAADAAADFSTMMANTAFRAAFETYFIANVATLGADTEIRAALVADGWTAPA